MSKNEERIKYFGSDVDSTLMKIVVCAVVFHFLVVAFFIGLHYVNLKPEPEQIPVFEMVQVAPPAPPKPPPPPKHEPPKPETPKPKEPPKPKVNKELPPEIKPEPEQKPEEVHEEVPPEPEPEPEPEPVDDFPVDDLELPKAVEAPSLNPVGSVDMDPLMQVYLEQLKKIIMGNFKPPKDLKVGRDAKTTVQFTVDRFGGITAVLLKKSSGNKAWDHLSVRAIQVSSMKVPPLPPNYRAPNLVLHFNFTPN